MVIKFEFKFKIGQSVWVKTDSEQNERIVTGYVIREFTILYLCKIGPIEEDYFDFELTDEIDIVKKTA